MKRSKENKERRLVIQSVQDTITWNKRAEKRDKQRKRVSNS